MSFQRIGVGLGGVGSIGFGFGDWNRTIVRKKIDGLCNPFGLCQRDVDAMSVVVFEGWSELVTACAFAVPRPVMVARFIDNNTAAGRRKGVPLESNAL